MSDPKTAQEMAQLVAKENRHQASCLCTRCILERRRIRELLIDCDCELPICVYCVARWLVKLGTI